MRQIFRIAAPLLLLTPAAWPAVLLIPDSGSDRVWALSPVDGSVISNAFLPNDGRQATVTSAIDSGRGSILLSDQINDRVTEYSYSGEFLGVLADSANNQLDNIRGITVRDNQLYVTVAGGALSGTVQRMNLDGTGQVSWVTGLDSPWYVHFRDNDVLISDSGTDDIARVALTGGPLLTPLVDGGASGTLNFPRQIFERDNGNLLVGGFSLPSGGYEYDASGKLQRFFANGTGARAVWELENGRYLLTGGTRIFTYDPQTEAITDVVNVAGSNFQHIGYSALPEPNALLLLAAGAAAALRRR